MCKLLGYITSYISDGKHGFYLTNPRLHTPDKKRWPEIGLDFYLMHLVYTRGIVKDAKSLTRGDSHKAQLNELGERAHSRAFMRK